MAWWEFLDNPSLHTTSGVLLTAGAIASVVLVGGLGLAYAYHAWQERKKKQRAVSLTPKGPRAEAAEAAPKR